MALKRNKASKEKLNAVDQRIAEIEQRNRETLDPTKMNYSQAILSIKDGHAVRLPEWTGYWFLDKDGKMKAFTRNGEVVESLWTEKYQHRTDFQVCSTLLGFDWAINALKNNKLVTRQGWNGKGMFLFMRPADTLTTGFIVEKVKSLPADLKKFYAKQDYIESPEEQGLTPVKFTAYICMKAADGTIVNGWLASQTDMLAEDWQLFQS
jgi:hypothetical protein